MINVTLQALSHKKHFNKLWTSLNALEAYNKEHMKDNLTNFLSKQQHPERAKLLESMDITPLLCITRGPSCMVLTTSNKTVPNLLIAMLRRVGLIEITPGSNTRGRHTRDYPMNDPAYKERFGKEWVAYTDQIKLHHC